jgi:hypothetical protein
MSSLRKAINDINLYVDPPVTVRKVTNALGEGGVPVISVRAILQKLEVIKARHLIFSKNSSSNMIEGHPFPTDMPSVIWPAGYDGCGEGGIHEAQIKEAWVFAHYFMWRAVQVMQYLERTSSHRRELWYDGYTSNIGSAPSFNNYSPRGWFGSYDGSRFRRIREVIEKVWNERFQSMEWIVKCRVNDSGLGAHPCYTTDANANHILFGTINLCNKWFNYTNHEIRAFMIIHEVFHWLRIPGTGVWVSDIHDYYVGDRAVLDYKGARPLYGNLAALIANEYGWRGRNYNTTTMNNDNYAYFIYILGSSIYNRITPMRQPMNFFPSLSFKW